MTRTRRPGDTSERRHGALGDLERAVALLRQQVDRALVGQADAKLGLLVALVAREHAYLEGPPGSGKSQLATAVAQASGARRHLITFHRDLREADLLGDVRLRREVVDQSSSGDSNDPRLQRERLELELIPGALLEAQLLQLEDLPRAPGEALGPLLQILGERRALGRELPLESAIATAQPAGLELPVDPLEPGQLDRFAIQVRLRGLVTGRSWASARQLLDRSALAAEESAASLQVSDRLGLQRQAAGLEIPEAVRDRYHVLLERLRAAVGDSKERALLSDRTFGRSVWKVLRAHASLRMASVVEASDLRALRLMTAARLPEELQEEVESLIEQTIAESDQAAQVGATSTMTSPIGGGEERQTSAEVSGETFEGSLESELPSTPRAEPERSQPADVDALLHAFVGRIERGRRETDADPGGQPRGYRPLRRLDELLDGDLLEALLFARGQLPHPPRTFLRTRRNAGGAVVVLRDVSSSMAGERNRWAADVVCGLVKVAARRQMRVGYVEFHHRALPKEVGGRLLHRSYAKLVDLAQSTQPLGQTNYEEPLRVALETLRGRKGHNRHVVMLTDGLPITGDTRVKRERALAHQLGVSLHTVFIGEGECPPVLDEISRETHGLRFRASSGGSGTLEVVER